MKEMKGGAKKLKWSNINTSIFMRRKYSERRLGYVDAIDFWKTSEEIAQKREACRKKGGLYFVFIEGPTGSGKQEMFWRLSSINYKTYSCPFIPFYLVNLLILAF